jgi:hypothetical protein
VDVLVVYKVDRLSLPLLDFAKVMDRCDGAEQMSERALRAVAHAGKWAEQRAAGLRSTR